MSGPNSKRRRNGLTLLIVVISLIVIAAILGGMIQHLLLGKRQSRQWRNHAQATALAESAPMVESETANAGRCVSATASTETAIQ